MLGLFENSLALILPSFFFLGAVCYIFLLAGQRLYQEKICSVAALGIGVIVCAAAVLLISPSFFQASDLRLVPDSVEYAIGAASFVDVGRYQLDLGQGVFPPRYLPWMSLWVLGPWYLLSPDNLGFGILAIGTHSWILGVALFLLGIRTLGSPGGVLLCAAPFCVPGFFSAARQILTEIPCAAALLASALGYVELRSRSGRGNILLLACGISVAWAVALRPLSLFVLLPFIIVLAREPRILGLSFFFLPTIVVGVLSASYHLETFGTVLRNGYQFWSSVPYDYFGEVFSLAYFPKNMALFFSESCGMLFTLASIVALLVQAKKREEREKEEAGFFLSFGLIGVLPVMICQLCYFFSSERLFIVPSLVGMALALLYLGKSLHFGLSARSLVVLAVTVLSALAALRGIVWERELPQRRMLADELSSHVPPGAVVITGLDPAYAAFSLRELSLEKLLPVSRRIEYASKLITPSAPPAGILPQKGSSFPAIPQVGVEQQDLIREYLRMGVPVYMERVFITEAEAGVLTQEFLLDEVSPRVVRLSLAQ